MDVAGAVAGAAAGMLWPLRGPPSLPPPAAACYFYHPSGEGNAAHFFRTVFLVVQIVYRPSLRFGLFRNVTPEKGPWAIVFDPARPDATIIL